MRSTPSKGGIADHPDDPLDDVEYICIAADLLHLMFVGVDVDARVPEETRREDGMAMKGRCSANSDTVYDESDSSATSNSREHSIRKKGSSTGRPR
jgi:hypothetical protein